MDVWSSIREQWRRWRKPAPLGLQGERIAAGYLKRLGYKIVARGRRDRLGEIDLVAVDGRTVVFVEVKTRRTHEAGGPLEAVGPDKQRRLSRLALGFLKRHHLLENPARFDVVGITWPDEQQRPAIDHVKNAFEAVGRWQMFG